MSAIAPVLTHRFEPLRRRLVRPYVITLAAVTLVAAAVGGFESAASKPWFFAALLGCVVLFQAVEFDLGNGHVAPTTVPSIALAVVFGPAGIIAGEAVLLVRNVARGEALMRPIFDFGSIGLAGTAAAIAASPLPSTPGGLFAAGMIAGTVYYVVNSGLLCVIWWMDEGTAPFMAFRRRLLPSAPHELAYGAAAGLLVAGHEELGLLVLAVVGVPAVALWVGQKQALAAMRMHVEELQAANDRMRAVMRQSVESLARTIEARDPYTGGHTERVADFAHLIAIHLGFRDEELDAVAVGAVVHDIGKIGVRDSVLLKQGPLDDDEWKEMRQHPETGSYILAELELPQLAKDMARHHHERFDGKGYPDGLAGEDIPLAARILTVADALDAMTSDRPYRKALPAHVALAELRDKAGVQFCPRVVSAVEELQATDLLGL